MPVRDQEGAIISVFGVARKNERRFAERAWTLQATGWKRLMKSSVPRILTEGASGSNRYHVEIRSEWLKEIAMLTVRDSRASRREFLQIGSLALGGLSLPWLLSARADGTVSDKPLTDKSVIFLFMHGGPSQIETFDPKMSAPAEIRSATGEVATALPGITLGGTFPRLARLIDKVAIVRSFVPGDANHDIKPVVSRSTFGAGLGSIYTHVAGLNHPHTGLPTNAALFPRAVDPTTQPGNMGFGKFTATGPLSAACAPFVPGGGGTLQQDMKLKLPLDRLEDRRSLLRGLDRAHEALDSATRAGLDNQREKAFRTILGGVADAFDLAKETPKTVSRYDTAPLVRPENISKKWNNHKNYADNAKSLGRLLLLARRLCERGCGFVTVTTNFVWDMHADQNNAGVAEGMHYIGLPFDHAVSAFLEDVEARGLSDKILLVCCGEMGRTPRINKNGGRDHWGNLAPLLLAGGGLRMGQVIGQSTRDGGGPLSQPVTIQHLVATIMHTLFDTGKLRVLRGLPRDFAPLLEWQPIPGLHG
jgi:uncharacterized protein (DUF1501 family)